MPSCRSSESNREEFWAECARVSKAERADALITYMHLLYKKAKEKGVRIDRADLVAQGQLVELYPGVNGSTRCTPT